MLPEIEISKRVFHPFGAAFESLLGLGLTKVQKVGRVVCANDEKHTNRLKNVNSRERNMANNDWDGRKLTTARLRNIRLKTFVMILTKD